MDSHDNKGSDDTSHLSASSSKSKKSTNKVVITLVAVVVFVAAVAVGLLAYKKVQDGTKSDDSAKTSQDSSNKELSPEEKMSDDLQKNAAKQVDAYSTGDDTKFIKESSAAAQNMTTGLNESDLNGKDKVNE